MCLISVAGKGKDKYSEEFVEALRNGASTNTDGMGFAYKSHKTKKVFIGKGYTDIDKLLSVLRTKRITLKDELIVHLRIGNRGSINTDMCHPFVLSENEDEILINNKIVDLPVMAHNGTFYDYRSTTVHSDTFQFIQEFMYHPTVIDLLKSDKDFFEKCFKDKLKTNRLVYLFPNCDDDLITLGDFIENDGYLYSNLSYKNKTIRNVGGQNESFNRHGYDDWSEDSYGNSHNNEKKWYNHNKAVNANRQIEFFPAHSKFREIEDDLEDEVNFGIPRETVYEPDLIGVDNSTNSRIKGFGEKLIDNPKKIGYRKADLDEIPFTSLLYSRNDSFTNSSRILFVEHLGLYIPEAFQEITQFKAIQIKPTDFNYNDLSLLAIKTDEDYSIKRDCYYLIQDINELEEYITVCLRYQTNTKKIFLNIPFYYIYELFKVKHLPELERKYNQYYRLVKDLNHSMTTLKRLKSFVNTSEEYSKGLPFTFEKVENIERPALDLYKYSLVFSKFRDNESKAETFLNNRFLS